MSDEEHGVPVLVVDDQAPFRLAARAVVRRAEGFDLVGEAESGEQAIVLAEDLHPALVLMDIKMPGVGGIEAARRIVEAAPDTVVFLCSTYQQSDLPPEAYTSGVRGYVHKEDLGPALLRQLWEGRDEVRLPEQSA